MSDVFEQFTSHQLLHRDQDMTARLEHIVETHNILMLQKSQDVDFILQELNVSDTLAHAVGMVDIRPQQQPVGSGTMRKCSQNVEKGIIALVTFICCLMHKLELTDICSRLSQRWLHQTFSSLHDRRIRNALVGRGVGLIEIRRGGREGGGVEREGLNGNHRNTFLEEGGRKDLKKKKKRRRNRSADPMIPSKTPFR